MSNAGLAASSTCGSSRSVARRSSWRLASAPVVVLKLVIRSLRLPSLRTSAAATFWLPLISRARSPRLGAQEGLVHDGGLAQRVGRVLQRVVQRLRRRLALRVGVLRGVLGRGGLAVERVAVALEQLLQVLAGGGLERAQHLVELHRRRGLGLADRAAVGQVGRAGGAGPDVHEEVALQEDPRADLQPRVAVDRQALLLDLHRDLGQRGVVAQRLDLRDLAHVHARDPHRRVQLQRGRVLEHRLHLVALGERDVLGEGEEHEHGQRPAIADRAGPQRGHAARPHREPPHSWTWACPR